MKTLILAAALTAAPTLAALADAPGITVTDAYARSTNPRSGAVFMTVANANAADCRITAATADVTPRAELHTHAEENGMMKMTPVEAVTILAGATHALERGGDHVMLMDTRTALAEGDEVALTLDFGPCGKVPVMMKVDNKAGMPGAHGHGAGHGAPAN